MTAIRELCKTYSDDDIYNMDETGLFWRSSPSSGLSTANIPGVKKDKARITAAFCVNYSGNDRLNPWLIGKAKRPHSLRNVNCAGLGITWKYQSKAWMDSLIMKDWLQYFYNHIGSSRRVILLLDNFSAHASGIDLNPPPPNIYIQWLPPNATSRYQPLDQGIIQNVKVYYRR